METPPESDSNLTDATRRVLWRLMAIGHNRSELLMVEIQEERERARLMLFLAAAAGLFGLLGAITLTAVIAIAAEAYYFIALIILAVIYLICAMIFYFKLEQLRRHWETMPGSRDQLQKDRECLEKHLV